MNFCISNIAWNENETKDVLKLLKKKKIRYLEYSPNLLLNNNFSRKKIRKVRKYWNEKCLFFKRRYSEMHTFLEKNTKEKSFLMK